MVDYDFTFETKSKQRTDVILAGELNLVELNNVQKERLLKLEAEIKAKNTQKDKNAQKNKALAESTGIPENLVNMNVVNIAIMLGLVKSQAIRDGREKDPGSLLSMLLTDDDYVTKKVSFANIPFYFKHHQNKVTEKEKLQYSSEVVTKECENFVTWITPILQNAKQYLNKYIVFEPKDNGIEAFANETITVANDLIEGIVEEIDDPEEMKTLINTLSIVRFYALGPLNYASYEKMVTSHYQLLSRLELDNHDNYFSFFDNRIVRSPSFRKRKPESLDSTIFRLSIECKMKCFAREQQLVTFNVSDTINRCCLPSLIYLDVRDVVKYGLLGPYQNNSVAYIDITDYNSEWSFYVLKKIKDDVRMWVLDHSLVNMTKMLRRELTEYLISLFKSWYPSAKFIPWSNDPMADVYDTLTRNLLFVNGLEFAPFLKYLIIKESMLIPTELDVFNTREYVKEPRQEYLQHPATVFSSMFKGNNATAIKFFRERFEQ